MSDEITVQEAATLLNLSPRAVQLMIQHGEITARRLHPWRLRSAWLIHRSEIERLLKPVIETPDDDPKTLLITSIALILIVIIPNLFR
jgi:excisionase family DNA binding protein